MSIIRLSTLGAMAALGAAACNGLVGTFSKLSMQVDLSFFQISFYKSIIGFIVSLVVCLCSKSMRSSLWVLIRRPIPVALCAFFGVFLLYFFETSAYSYLKVSEVVFVLMFGSAMTSAILGIIVVKERIQTVDIVSLLLALFGIFLLSESSASLSYMGVMLAFISGIGYGGYLVIARYYKIKSSIPFLCALLGMGSFYLAIPFLYQADWSIPQAEAFSYLVFLALVPTLGGFYLTTKALEYLVSHKVQLLELSEPVFALIFAMLFLGEFLTTEQLFSVAIIICALYLPALKSMNWLSFRNKNALNKVELGE